MSLKARDATAEDLINVLSVLMKELDDANRSRNQEHLAHMNRLHLFLGQLQSHILWEEKLKEKAA